MATYDITWTITDEVDEELFPTEEERMKAVVERAFDMLQDHGNDWVWNVVNKQTNKVYEIDYEFASEEEGPVIKELKTEQNVQ
jgi:hypothetical protein